MALRSKKPYKQEREAMLSFELTDEEKRLREEFVRSRGKVQLDSSFSIEYELSADGSSTSCMIRHKKDSKLIAVRSL